LGHRGSNKYFDMIQNCPQ